MKVLDRYIIRELLAPILYMALALIFLILIADLFDNLDELLRHQTPPAVILRYYLCLIPYAFIEIIPWAAWLGMVFLQVSFGFHNETLAMKAVGLKITTIVRPILFMGFLVGIFAFLVGDRVVPATYRIANELREAHIEKRKHEAAEEGSQNVTYYAKGNELYYFRHFSADRKEVEGAVVLWLSYAGGSNRKKMVAQRGRWNGSSWGFEAVTEYLMDSHGRILGEPVTFARKDYPEMTFSPSELAAASSDSMFLSYRQLKQWTEKLEENGVRVDAERVDLQNRLAQPWQGLVMIMVSLPLLSRLTHRKRIAFNVLVCVGLVFAYQVFGAVAVALGKAGKIFPFLSVWAGSILFAAGALLHLEKANY